MSAPSCLAFYGIRIELLEDEIEALEERSDPRLVAARKNGLKSYWGNFDVSGERWLLFIGASLGVFGIENQMEVQYDIESLNRLMSETELRIRKAGFNEMLRLYIQWHPDT